MAETKRHTDVEIRCWAVFKNETVATEKFFGVGFSSVFGARGPVGSDYFLVRLGSKDGSVQALRRRTRKNFYVIKHVISTVTLFLLQTVWVLRWKTP